MTIENINGATLIEHEDEINSHLLSYGLYYEINDGDMFDKYPTINIFDVEQKSVIYKNINIDSAISLIEGFLNEKY